MKIGYIPIQNSYLKEISIYNVLKNKYDCDKVIFQLEYVVEKIGYPNYKLYRCKELKSSCTLIFLLRDFLFVQHTSLETISILNKLFKMKVDVYFAWLQINLPYTLGVKFIKKIAQIMTQFRMKKTERKYLNDLQGLKKKENSNVIDRPKQIITPSIRKHIINVCKARNEGLTMSQIQQKFDIASRTTIYKILNKGNEIGYFLTNEQLLSIYNLFKLGEDISIIKVRFNINSNMEMKNIIAIAKRMYEK